MKQYVKVYSKLFFGMLPFFIPVGIITGIMAFIFSPVLLLSITDNPDIFQFMSHIGLFTCLGTMIFFSGIMSIAIGSVHIVSIKTSPFAEIGGAMKTRQQRNIKILTPYRDAFGLCLAPLESIGNAWG